MDHQAYLMDRFDRAMVFGHIDLFCPEFRPMYNLMADAQIRRLTPGELVTAWEYSDAVITVWKG